MKNKLKKLKYLYTSLLLLLRRTIFSSFYKIRVPIKRNIKIGRHVAFYNEIRMIFFNGAVEIGCNTEICNYSKFIIGGGQLKIGQNCLLGEYGIYNVFSNLVIGNDVMTADRVSFVTNIHQYENVNIPIRKQKSSYEEIVVGDGTWIGMNVTILAGSHIGKNCVVAAHCVVKGNYPDNCVIGGIPSHILKQYNEELSMWEKV